MTTVPAQIKIGPKPTPPKAGRLQLDRDPFKSALPALKLFGSEYKIVKRTDVHCKLFYLEPAEKDRKTDKKGLTRFVVCPEMLCTKDPKNKKHLICPTFQFGMPKMSAIPKPAKDTGK